MKHHALKKVFTTSALSFILFTAPTLTIANNAVSNLPDLGSTAENILSPRLADKIGSAFIRQARSQMKFVEDPILLDYLNTLGNKLAKAATAGTEDESQKFTFHLIEDPTLNAFAVPGGHIVVHTGLVLDSRNEPQLAATLAHEIAHITENHSGRGIENSKYDSAIAIASILVAVASGDPKAAQVAITASQGGLVQKRLNYTRGFEREADNKAIITLNKAGYNPTALSDFLRILDRRQNLSGANPPAFLLTHPLTSERISETELRARSYPRAAANTNSQAFKDFKASLAVEFHEKPTKIASFYRINKGAFNDSSDHFKYGLALIKLDRYAEAEKQLSLAIDSDPKNLNYLIALNELDVARRNYSSAAGRYERLKKSDPITYEKVAIYHANTLITAKSNELAIPVLAEVINNHPEDPLARILMARAYGELGLLFKSYQQRALYHYLRGNLNFSIKQLDNALSLAPNDYEKKKIKALKAQYKDEQRKTESALKKL